MGLNDRTVYKCMKKGKIKWKKSDYDRIIYYACKIPDMLKEPYYNSVKIPLY